MPLGVIQINAAIIVTAKIIFMHYRIIFQILAIGFLTIATIGCATTEKVSQTIESEAIQEIVKSSSELKIPLKKGATIAVYTHKKINLSSWNVDYVKMVVKDVNDKKIKGKVESACCDSEQYKEEIEGYVAEIKLEDIDRIDVLKKTTKMTSGTKDTLKVTFWVIVLLLIFNAAGEACAADPGECSSGFLP